MAVGGSSSRRRTLGARGRGGGRRPAATTSTADRPAAAATRNLQTIITGDNILDLRSIPPTSIILSPTPTKPNTADVDVVKKAMERVMVESLLAEAEREGMVQQDEVQVEIELGGVVEMTFVEEDGGRRKKERNLRGRELPGGPASASASTADASVAADASDGQRRAQTAGGYTIIGFDESRVTYKAPLLSDFTPPSQNQFEKETLVSVMDDVVQKLPKEIVRAGGKSGALAGLVDATADLTYVPPRPQEQVDPEVEPEKEEEVDEVDEVIAPVESDKEKEEVEEEEETPAEVEEEPVDDQQEEEQEGEQQAQDGDTLTLPEEQEEVDSVPPAETEEDEEEEGGGGGGEQESEQQQPPKEKDEIFDAPAEEEEQESEVDEAQDENNDQQDVNSDVAVLPVPVPAPGSTTEEEDSVNDTDSNTKDIPSSPQDDEDDATTATNVPPPLFGAGDYTGDNSVSSVGTMEGGQEVNSSNGSGGASTGAVVGSVLAILVCAALATLFLVKRRRKKNGQTKNSIKGSVRVGDGDIENGVVEIDPERTFELDDDGELVLNGMHVEPAYDDKRNGKDGATDYDDDDDDEEEEQRRGYLPAAYSGIGSRSRLSSSGGGSTTRNGTPRKAPPQDNDDDDDEDEDDSVFTDWSGGPSVNSLGHSVQGSAADEEYDDSGIIAAFKKKKKKKHKKSKSADLSSPPRIVRTESFEHHRNAAGVSLRKDMLCTVDTSGGFPMQSRSRSADHSSYGAFGGSDTSPMRTGPEAGWIWGSRNEADLKPRNGYVGEGKETL